MTTDTPERPPERAPNASKLRLRYGDCAAEYAEVREETAKDLGDRGRAEHWHRVEQELRADDAP